MTAKVLQTSKKWGFYSYAFHAPALVWCNLLM